MSEYEQRVIQDRYPPTDPPQRPGGPGWYIVTALAIGNAAIVYVWERDVTPDPVAAPVPTKKPVGVRLSLCPSCGKLGGIHATNCMRDRPESGSDVQCANCGHVARDHGLSVRGITVAGMGFSCDACRANGGECGHFHYPEAL